ncbi:hypothetical protein Tgr7_1719 [Thioalkalivibrio sulfidiphilus HL-EbGr7]|uniref:Uncharacterized protein n=1 Tax=Thioalkalivibrio sulfidiphilus (strain HL-EbGR7) TaxID=396588 RepID=B8GS97_THISH|nr:hypothetical protein Tgr7_1719 [Thioalkalivibrio sulfidiphilus HL-EbGr7]
MSILSNAFDVRLPRESLKSLLILSAEMPFPDQQASKRIASSMITAVASATPRTRTPPMLSS